MLKCYGQHSANRKACKTCEYRIWCEDSQKLDKQSISNCAEYTAIEFMEQYATNAELPQEERRHPSKLLSELIWSMHDTPEKIQPTIKLLHRIAVLYQSNRSTFRVILTKVLHPEMTYDKIAIECELKSKQLVDYHIKRAIQLLPELEHAILFDHRRHPQKYHNSLTLLPKLRNKSKLKVIFKEFLKKNYGSLEAFCTENGFNYSTIHTIINEPRQPRLKTRRKIADALNITLDELNEEYGL